jgi:exonuclease III
MLVSSPVHRFGSRVLAVRLTVRDGEDKALEVTVVCAYAPATAAPTAEKDEFLAQFSECIASRRSHEVLMIGGDFNAALGKRRVDEQEQRLRRSVLGPRGVQQQNAEGNALLELIVEHDLCVAQSLFQKKQYATLFHPGTRLGYQHDL